MKNAQEYADEFCEDMDESSRAALTKLFAACAREAIDAAITAVESHRCSGCDSIPKCDRNREHYVAAIAKLKEGTKP